MKKGILVTKKNQSRINRITRKKMTASGIKILSTHNKLSNANTKAEYFRKKGYKQIHVSPHGKNKYKVTGIYPY